MGQWSWIAPFQNVRIENVVHVACKTISFFQFSFLFCLHKSASLPMKNTICLSLFSYTASTWVKFLGNPVHNLSISCGYPAYKPWLPIRHRYCTERMDLLKYRTRVFVQKFFTYAILEYEKFSPNDSDWIVAGVACFRFICMWLVSKRSICCCCCQSGSIRIITWIVGSHWIVWRISRIWFVWTFRSIRIRSFGECPMTVIVFRIKRLIVRIVFRRMDRRIRVMAMMIVSAICVVGSSCRCGSGRGCSTCRRRGRCRFPVRIIVPLFSARVYSLIKNKNKELLEKIN